MEPLLKLPMLYFDLKESHNEQNFAFVQTLIAKYYHEDPASFSLEIRELENLRQSALRVAHDINGCSILKRYYAQLVSMRNRFCLTNAHNPILDANGQKFVWIDNLTKEKVTGDLNLELDSILHNIGALHSELGALGHRENSDNMKIVCTHYQCAAWVYEQLRSRPHFQSKDLSHDIVDFNYKIMLAQAQECVLEKSILNSFKCSTISKVSAQVVDYYQEISALLTLATVKSSCASLLKVVGSALFEEWRLFIDFKAAYYSAVTSYFTGQMSDELAIGERIAWYQNAEQNLKNASQLAKNTKRQDVADAVAHLMQLIKKSMDQTKKENDFIYHEHILNQEQLTAIKGRSLVQPIEFSVSDPDIMGKDIFHRLIPIQAYEHVSIYSERKDQLWRETKKKIDAKNDELMHFISVLGLDSDNIRQRKFFVPSELVKICATLRVNSNLISETEQKFTKLDDMCKTTNLNLSKIKKILVDIDANQATVKVAGLEPFRKTFEENEKACQNALKSNETLRKMFDGCREDIQMLMRSSVKDLEEMFSPKAEDLPSNEENLQELERLFDKVREMETQREKLETDLQKKIQEDDILKEVLVCPADGLNDLFAKELKKYDEIIGYLCQNLVAQERVMEALTKANADYSVTRKAFNHLEELRKKRVDVLLETYNDFEHVKANLENAIEFFAKLDKVLDQLEQQLTAHIKKQEIEFKQKQKPLPTLPTSVSVSAAGIGPATTRPLSAGTQPSAPKLRDYLDKMKEGATSAVAYASLSSPGIVQPSSINPLAAATSSVTWPSATSPSTYSAIPPQIGPSTYTRVSASATLPTAQLSHASYYQVSGQPQHTAQLPGSQMPDQSAVAGQQSNPSLATYYGQPVPQMQIPQPRPAAIPYQNPYAQPQANWIPANKPTDMPYHPSSYNPAATLPSQYSMPGQLQQQPTYPATVNSATPAQPAYPAYVAGYPVSSSTSAMPNYTSIEHQMQNMYLNNAQQQMLTQNVSPYGYPTAISHIPSAQQQPQHPAAVVKPSPINLMDDTPADTQPVLTPILTPTVVNPSAATSSESNPSDAKSSPLL